MLLRRDEANVLLGEGEFVCIFNFFATLAAGGNRPKGLVIILLFVVWFGIAYCDFLYRGSAKTRRHDRRREV